jgi:tripartite-type tricarboxylate transporter receptor subunit TctC
MRRGRKPNPDKPIRLIVPAGPGGPTDVPARLLSQILPKLGQPVVVENRAGAGGAIGARAVVAAPPDGYTLLVGNTSVFAVAPAVSASAGYDPTRQLAAVAKFSESYQILVVLPDFPTKSAGELIALAKRRPGELNYAHTGVGGLPHMTGELFKSAAGVDIVGVPYKSGGESVTAVLGGQVQMTFESITILLPLIREGRLRALAVTSRVRTPLAPDLPTMIEADVACRTTRSRPSTASPRPPVPRRRSSRGLTPPSTKASSRRKCRRPSPSSAPSRSPAALPTSPPSSPPRSANGRPSPKRRTSGSIDDRRMEAIRSHYSNDLVLRRLAQQGVSKDGHMPQRDEAILRDAGFAGSSG